MQSHAGFSWSSPGSTPGTIHMGFVIDNAAQAKAILQSTTFIVSVNYHATNVPAVSACPSINPSPQSLSKWLSLLSWSPS
jgi:hypothetical protein